MCTETEQRKIEVVRIHNMYHNGCISWNQGPSNQGILKLNQLLYIESTFRNRIKIIQSFLLKNTT